MKKKKSKNKVCIVSLSAYPLFDTSVKATFGGAEVQLYQIAKKLSTDFRVSFIVGDYNQKKKQELEDILIIRSINLINSDRIMTKLIKAFKLFSDLIKANASVYIQRSASMGTGLIALYCKLFNKRFIYMTAHEIDCNGDFKRQSGKIKGVLYEFGLRKSYKVISQSNEQKKLLRSTYNIDSEIIHSVYQIPHYLDRSDYHKKNVLWVGRCEYWKRPELFITLARKNSDYKFIMIMPRANNSDYYDLVQESNSPMPENLTIINYVPFHDIGKYFEQASVFVNTSIYEGFPNTFIQSAMNAIPILSLSVDPDQVIERFKLGRICNNHEERLHIELNDLLSDKDEYIKTSKNCYNYAKKYHDIDTNIQILKKIIA